THRSPRRWVTSETWLGARGHKRSVVWIRCLEKEMSTEQTQLAPVRLLIAESSENSAHEFDSMLRDAGIPTRMRLVDLPMAGDALATADLMLCNAELP